MFVLLGPQGLFNDNFSAGNRNILQGAMEAIQRSKTLGVFDRAKIQGARSSQGQPSEGKSPDRLDGSRGDLSSLGSGDKGGIGGRRVMDALRPSHSLATRASGLGSL